jgi:hypothetical protein
VVVQHEGEAEPERALEGHGDQRVDEGVPDRLIEDRIAQEIHEVPQADELAHGTDRAVREPQPDAEEERVGHEHHEQADPGQHEDHAEARLAVQQ